MRKVPFFKSLNMPYLNKLPTLRTSNTSYVGPQVAAQALLRPTEAGTQAPGAHLTSQTSGWISKLEEL